MDNNIIELTDFEATVPEFEAAVYYHANCYDGFGAAWACWNKFRIAASYTAVTYGEPMPLFVKAKDCYVVDFCFDIPDMIRLCEEYETVYLIDHHKTAIERVDAWEAEHGALPANLDINLNIEKSGALLTWEQLFPETQAPQLIEYISDRDLWEFKMGATKLVHLALKSYPMDFQTWDNFDIQKLVDRGASCERLHERLVTSICDNAWITNIDGYEVPVVNTSIAWSEVGEELLKRFPEHPFSASFTTGIDSNKFSLRSRADGDNFDVSELAKKFDGGGHRNAAGFSRPRAGLGV